MAGGGGNTIKQGGTYSKSIVLQYVFFCVFFNLLMGLFNHYQGHPGGSVCTLSIVLVALNTECGSRFLLLVSFPDRNVSQ